MKKRILVNLITLALVISLFSGDMPVEAKRKAALSKKKVSLEVGKSIKLKLKNNKKKVKWSTDKKKIVKLSNKSKKGVTIQAVKVGKAKVTAKIGKKKYVCRVTVTKKRSKKNENDSVPSQDTVTVPASIVPSTQAPVPNPVTQSPGQQNPDEESGSKETAKPGQSNVPEGTERPEESANPLESEQPEESYLPVSSDEPEGTITVSGTVKDAEGTLLKGIEVYVGEKDEEGYFSTQYKAKTTEQGTYTFSALQKNKWYEVRIGQVGDNAARINTADETTYHIQIQKSLIKVNGMFEDVDAKPLKRVQIALYDSNESLTSGPSEGEFETDAEGRFDVYMEKNRVYYVKVSGLGKNYFPGKIDTSKQNQTLQIEDSVVSVSGVLKNQDETVRKNEQLYFYGENDYTWYSRTITTGDSGEYSFSMPLNFSYLVKIQISGVYYSIGTIVAGDESTYDLNLDFKLSDINGSLKYANGKYVNETQIDAIRLAAYRSESDNAYEFQFLIEVKEGKYNIQLRTGDTYYLKVLSGGKTYSAGILTAGEETTYDLKLDVSLQTIEGTLLSSNGTKFEKECIHFYDNSEYSGNYQSIYTDESGKYKVILEEDTVYYASVSLTGQTYEITNIKTGDNSHDLIIETSLEKINPVIKDSKGIEFEYWYLYEDEDGEIGKSFYTKSPNESAKKPLYLENGKKFHIKVARGNFIDGQTSAEFYAGVLTAGNPDSYNFTIATSKVTGKVTDAFGNIVSSEHITKEKGYWYSGIWDNSRYYNNVFISLKDKQIGEGTSVRISSDTFTAELLEGRHYDVSVTINNKSFPVGELVAGDESTYNFQIRDIVKVDGNVRDGNNQLLKEKKLYFWEGENVKMQYGGPAEYTTYCGVDANGNYELYLETGKAYSIMAQVCDEVNNNEYVSVGSITIAVDGKNTYDLKCSEIEIKGNLKDASGKAVQSVWVRFYENENDSDYDSKITKHPDVLGEFSVWLDKKTYYVRVQKVSGGKYIPIGKLTVGEEDTYNLVFNEEEDVEGN